MARVVVPTIILIVSGLIGLLSWRVGCHSVPQVQLVAFTGAFLALFWSVIAALGQLLARIRRRPATEGNRVTTLWLAALMFAVVPVVIETFVLVVQTVYVGIDLVYGRHFGGPGAGFGRDGLWTLVTLALACGIALMGTRDRRLLPCLQLLFAAILMWICWLTPALVETAPARLERSGHTVWLILGLALVIMVTAIMGGQLARRRKAMAGAVVDLQAENWSGMTLSTLVIGLLVLLLVAYHVVVPVHGMGMEARATLFVVGISGTCGGIGCLILLRRSWNGVLADVSLAIFVFSFCALVLCLVPRSELMLAERYPSLLAAMIVGLIGSCGLLIGCSDRWRRAQRPKDSLRARLGPHARRMAFFAAALALLVGALMAVWPRLEGIATADDTLPDMASGLAAHLFMVLVLLWVARRVRRITFNGLVLFALVDTVAYIVVRFLPFKSTIG